MEKKICLRIQFWGQEVQLQKLAVEFRTNCPLGKNFHKSQNEIKVHSTSGKIFTGPSVLNFSPPRRKAHKSNAMFKTMFAHLKQIWEFVMSLQKDKKTKRQKEKKKKYSSIL